MFDSIVLGITRLTDPLKSAGKDNLVLRQLVEQVKACDDGVAADLGLDDKISEIENRCQVFVRIRNKRIAHNDLKVSQYKVSDETEILAASREQVEHALSAIREFLNLIERRFSGRTTLYEWAITGLGDGDMLIRHLESLRRYRADRRSLNALD